MSLSVTVDFNANLAKFEKSLDKANAKFAGFANDLEKKSGKFNGLFAGLGAGISVAGITSFIKTGIDAADMLNDLSDRTGVAVETLSGLEYAAKLGDTSIEAVGKGINKLSIYMQKNAEDAAKLGLSLNDPAQALIDFAGVFSSVEDATQRAALGNAVLGKSYAELAPLLMQGSQGLADNIKKGQEMSGITKELSQNAGKFNDKLDEMNTRISSLSINLAGPVVESLNRFITKLQEAYIAGQTFNSLAIGVGNFIFDTGELRSFSAELDNLNEKIAHQKEMVKTLESEKPTGSVKQIAGGMLDRALGYNASEEKKKLDDLLNQRQQILDKHHKQNEDFSKKIDDDEQKLKEKNEKLQQTLAGIIGGGGAASSQKKTSLAQSSRSTKASVDPLDSETAQIFESTRTPLEKLDAELERYRLLLDKDKISTDTFNRAALESMNAYTDATEALKDYNARQKEAAEITDAARTPLEKLSADIDKYKSLLDQKLISPETYTRATLQSMQKNGFAEMESKGKDAFDKIDSFSEQAARNIQDSFADFLFDPFSDGLDGMVLNFGKAIQRMVAEQAAADLLGKDGLNVQGLLKEGSGVVTSGIKNFFSGLFHEGGEIGAPGGRQIAVDPRIFIGAERFHSGGYPGLKSDEVPAILQVGERVLSKKEVAQGVAIGVDQKTFERLKESDYFKNVKRYHDGGLVQQAFMPKSSAPTNLSPSAGRGNITVNVNINGSSGSMDRKSASNFAYQIGVETQRAINRNS